jgi:hypothetical protein
VKILQQTSHNTTVAAHSSCSSSCCCVHSTKGINVINAAAVPNNKSLFTIIRHVTTQNGIRGLFAGNGVMVLRIIPFSLCLGFLLNSAMQNIPVEWLAGERNEVAVRLAVWSITASIAVTVAYPLDTARALLAVEHSQRMNMRTVLRKQYNAGQLYRGLLPAVCAVAPFIAVQDTLYELLCQTAHDVFLRPPSVPLYLASGAIAGCVAQTIIHPLDSLHRQMQVQTSTEIPINYWNQIRNTIHKEGLRGLWKGLPVTLLMVAPRTAISYGIFNTIIDSV